MISVEVDLRKQFGPVRDQGARPTCLAFATSDTHAALRGSWTSLSCEYIFYHAQKKRGNPPDQGAYLEDMLFALKEQGQPAEEDWPYLANLPADISTYAPPTGIRKIFARNGNRHSNKVDEIVRLLDHGQPSIILSVITLNFFKPPENGIISIKDGDTVFPTPRHAVVAVGYGSYKTDRVILIRNSWGPTWCEEGYAWLSEDFLNKHMYDLALLSEECDVPNNTAAA